MQKLLKSKNFAKICIKYNIKKHKVNYLKFSSFFACSLQRKESELIRAIDVYFYVVSQFFTDMGYDTGCERWRYF